MCARVVAWSMPHLAIPFRALEQLRVCIEVTVRSTPVDGAQAREREVDERYLHAVALSSYPHSPVPHHSTSLHFAAVLAWHAPGCPAHGISSGVCSCLIMGERRQKRGVSVHTEQQ